MKEEPILKINYIKKLLVCLYTILMIVCFTIFLLSIIYLNKTSGISAIGIFGGALIGLGFASQVFREKVALYSDKIILITPLGKKKIINGNLEDLVAEFELKGSKDLLHIKHPGEPVKILKFSYKNSKDELYCNEIDPEAASNLLEKIGIKVNKTININGYYGKI